MDVPTPSPSMDLGAALEAAVPNDVAPATPSPTPAPTAQPTPSPTPAPTPAPASMATPAATPSVHTPQNPGQAVAVTPPTQVAQPQQPATLREWAVSQGFTNAAQYADDVSFMQATLASQNTYAQQLAQMRQQLQAQQANLAPAIPAVQPPRPADPLARFKAPEYNPAWRDMIVAVPEAQGGGFKVVDGADPTILTKMAQYEQWRQQNARDFTADPMAFVRPMVQHEAQQMAQQIFQQAMQQRETQAFIDQRIAQSESWMYQHDPSGNRIINQADGYALKTPLGERYIQYLRHYETKGMSPQDAAEVADGLIQRDMAQPWLQQQRAEALSRQQAAAVTAQGRAPASMTTPAAAPTGSLVGAAGSGHQAPTPPNSNLTLSEMLERNLTNVAV